MAERLNQLGDDWYVLWGFHYADGHGGMREGDFVILGPKGHVLVMEVKGSQSRQFLLTGQWEDEADGDNPLEQLNREWQAVIDKFDEAAEGAQKPWIGRALCMPNLNKVHTERLHAQFDRCLVIVSENLQHFEAWWRQEIEQRHANRCDSAVRLFHKAIVPGQRPAPGNIFIKETDRIFERYRRSESGVLEMIDQNARWIVEGGPGTGKTFLALKRAQQLAESGSGLRVLFLCYNLILAERLEELIEKIQPKQGEIVVRSWEALVGGILERESIPLEQPRDSSERFNYYMRELPGYVSSILKENPPEPEFDALVVDEAQDHDTAFAETMEGDMGWWDWYFALLKEGVHSPIALFLDRAQRPHFRRDELFSLDRLQAALPDFTHLKLNRILRYTRPIYETLLDLAKPVSADFEKLRIPETHLPTGPKVLRIQTDPSRLAAEVDGIVRSWLADKLCSIDDIVILGRRRTLADSGLGNTEKIHNAPVVDFQLKAPRGQLRYLGLHRAKGLDFLAVILIDVEGPRDPGGEIEPLIFPAATRARQLLAICETVAADEVR